MTDPKLSISTAHGRHYKHPLRNKLVPSITNIKDKLHKPGLTYWAARQSAEYAATNLDKLQMLTVPERVQLIRSAPFSRTEESPSAIGDIVHDWCDRFIKGGTVSHDETEAAPLTARRMWAQFRAFNDRYKPQYTESEFTVWSDKYGYAGTGDWYGTVGNYLVLADNKTGKAVYPETGMQLAAIANADYILDEDGTERELPRFDKFAVLHLRPTYYHFIPVERIEDCFAAFLSLHGVFDWEVNTSDQVLAYAPKIKGTAA